MFCCARPKVVAAQLGEPGRPRVYLATGIFTGGCAVPHWAHWVTCGGCLGLGAFFGAVGAWSAAGEILRETTPGGEIQFLGVLELGEVAVQPRTLGQQAEDSPLIEHVDLVFPDHIVDGGQFTAVTDQQRGKACEAVAHQCTSGSGMASANPARNTGWAKPSGATSAAAPSGTPSAYRTEPSATI